MTSPSKTTYTSRDISQIISSNGFSTICEKSCEETWFHQLELLEESEDWPPTFCVFCNTPIPSSVPFPFRDDWLLTHLTHSCVSYNDTTAQLKEISQKREK